MTEPKVTKEEMLECLKEWAELYFHEVDCSEKYLQETLGHHNQAYQAIRALIKNGQIEILGKING